VQQIGAQTRKSSSHFIPARTLNSFRSGVQRCGKAAPTHPAKQRIKAAHKNAQMASFASPLQPLSNGTTSIAADEELLYTLEDVRSTGLSYWRSAWACTP
jgi:hypothetical protein